MPHKRPTTDLLGKQMKTKDRWSCLSLLIAYILCAVKNKRGCKTASAFPFLPVTILCATSWGWASSGHIGCSSPLFITAPREIRWIFSWVEPGAQLGKHHIESWTAIQQQLRNTNPHRAGSSQRSRHLEQWAGVTQPLAFITTGCTHSCYQPTEDQGRNIFCPRRIEKQTPESPPGEHRAEVLKWEQLIAWQMVGLSAGAQKTVCSTRLVQKIPQSFSFGKEGKKIRTIRETKSTTSILFLKRITEDANRKVIPYWKSTSKCSQENKWIALSISQYLITNQRKHSKLQRWKKV